MKIARVLYHLVKADFMERIRRYGTPIIIGGTIFLTFLYLPPMGASYLGFNLGPLRGVYNAAWVGGTVTVMTVILMGLPGFYLVKNAISWDRRTRVGQILATTPLTKAQYTLGKMLSNWIYLSAMAGVALVAAMGIQLIRGEVIRIELAGYLTPYILITLPMMALIAALAVSFESISWLRGGFGNVAFFFLFLISYWMMAALGFMVLPSVMNTGEPVFAWIPEPTGALTIFSEMMLAGKAQNPGYTGGLAYWELTGKYGDIETFVWEGLSWGTPLLVIRMAWVCASIGLASLAAVFFDRFDPAKEDVDVEVRSKIENMEDPVQIVDPSPPYSKLSVLTKVNRTPLSHRSGVSEMNILFRCVWQELRLMLKGVRWYWYVVTGGLILLEVLRPFQEARQVWLALAWLWPILIWSQLGNRELQHRTSQMIFSAAFPLRRQMPVTWLAGFVLAIVTGSGSALRFILAGEWNALYALLVGAAFIPALALAFGVWSGSSKLFEVVYLVLWTFGPLNQILKALSLPPLTQSVVFDFLGATGESSTVGIPLYYLLVTIFMLAVAFVGRKKQLRV